MRDEPATLKSLDGGIVPLEKVSARGRSRGLAFELTVEQRYRNARDTNIEAVYTFPLPVDAVLLDLEVELGERRLVANVVEKKDAERDYEEAIVKGDTAIMLERAGNGLYTLNLGNLMAGESAVIRYRYSQFLRFQHGSVRLTIPTVIAPRYGDPVAGGLAPHQAPTTNLLASYPFTLAIDLDRENARGEITSPSHAIATRATEEGMHVELVAGAFLDRDFVLSIGKLAGRTLTAVTHDGDGYVALASFCVKAPQASVTLPITAKLLVDCSGSMAGDSIEAAKRAMHRIFANLDSEDRASLTCFGSSTRQLTSGLVQGTPSHIRKLAEAVGHIDANMGGTEMESALREVFEIGSGACAADVLVLTDGEVWNATGVIDAARAAKQRVFAVGIGAAPAEGVLRGLAEATGGACEFVAATEDAEAAILRMFARIRAPRFATAEVRWPAKPTWEVPLPSGLFAGETIHAMARFDRTPEGEATIALRADKDMPALTSTCTFGAAIDDARTLARMAASRHLSQVDAEAQLALALEYRLLTDRTNLIVVHERAAGEKAVDLPQLAQVAQMHAAGWGGVGTVAKAKSVGRRVDSYSVDRAAFSLMMPSMVHESMPSFCAIDEPMDWMTEFVLQGPVHALNIAYLAAAGIPDWILDELRALVADGASEEDVVTAFLEAIVVHLKASSRYGRKLRTLRRAIAGRAAPESLQTTISSRMADWAFAVPVGG